MRKDEIMDKLAEMYITLLPVILAGIMNMVWCKTSLLKALKKPMDMGKCLSDGKRIFGDNKTWKEIMYPGQMEDLSA